MNNVLYLYQQNEIINLKNKTMKAQTLKNRLSKRYSGSKNTVAYRTISALTSNNQLLRPVHTSGSGRFTSNLDYTSDFKELLDIVGLKYEFGNDAPKGGLTGNYFKILTKID